MGLFNETDDDGDDNYRLLPGSLQIFYKNPYRAFGLDEASVTIAAVRDSFRKVCLTFTPYFSALGTSKMTLPQIVFSYHLIRGSLKGNAKKIADSLKNNPYLDFRADDILPLLRPVRSSLNCPKEYRGFRMLGVSCIGYRTEFAYVKLPKVVFCFDVHYCMRKHTVEKSYEDFLSLHELLAGELLTLPTFPEPSFMQSVGLEKSDAMGQHFSTYIMRIHNTLANKGMFSARLFRFLGIDFEKVQSEEEGVLMSLLDTPNNPPGTVYHIISEEWLQKWRRFAMGRGARRYVPPGRITNGHILEVSRRVGKKTLKLAKDYRCINYNVWRLYELVHGGGPCISRKEENIYSVIAMSHLQAVIHIQSRLRIFLAQCRKATLYTAAFSTRQAAKAVLYLHLSEELQLQAEDIIRKDQLARTKDKMQTAAQFTQAMWRNKKKYVPEESLERRRADQEVFARSKGGVLDENSGPEGLVVTDVHSIVHIGSTSAFVWRITEEEGKVPFRLKRIPGTESAIVADTENDQVPNGSKILSVNSYPASSMSYQHLKLKLSRANWPLVLELERPLKSDQLPTLDIIVAMQEPTLQYNGFKILLSSGLLVVKHNSGNGKSHITQIRITDKEFFYKSKHDPQKNEEEMWNKFSLFNLKFMLNGSQSETIQKKSKKDKSVRPEHCFEVVNEARGIAFELPDDEKCKKMCNADGIPYISPLPASLKARKQFIDLKEMTAQEYHRLKCKLLYDNFKKLVLEVRSSQIFLDKDGMPVKRTTAKTSLRKIDSL